MAIENRRLTDEQIALGLQIVRVLGTSHPYDVITAMMAIITHAINQMDDPDTIAKFWADSLVATVRNARENGGRSFGGRLQ